MIVWICNRLDHRIVRSDTLCFGQWRCLCGIVGYTTFRGPTTWSGVLEVRSA